MFTLPPNLVKTITGVYGDAGVAWLMALPETLTQIERAWRVTAGPLLPNLSFNVVCEATSASGEPLILKLGVPCREIACEMAALHAYAGHGAVRLVNADPEGAALLLERVVPGKSLLSIDDDAEATRIAAVVMHALDSVPTTTYPFPSVADWGKGFERMRTQYSGDTGPLPSPLVQRAEAQFAELLASSTPPVLLHGDLHHDNILSDGDRWVVIDPKGVLGEPAYEVGAYMRNWLSRLLHEPDPRAILARRLDIFSETLSIPRERLQAWSFAQAVLSAWWTIEDGDDNWEPTIRCAELIESA